MIIDFTIENFRSIKEKTTLSLEASGAKGKSNNVFEVTTKNGKTFRLLKTAVIYGANASGKSNVIRAFWAFRQLIAASFRYDVNDPLSQAEAFELDPDMENQPTRFTLNFIAWDKQRYIYSVAILRNEGIIEESLKVYQKSQAEIVFKRHGRKVEMKLPKFFKEKKSSAVINPKRLFLSELGNSGDKSWEDLRNYFILGNSVVNAAGYGMTQQLREAAKQVFESNQPTMVSIRNRIIRLVQLSDLGIKSIRLEEEEIENPTVAPDVLSESDAFSGEPRKQKKFKTEHEVYKDRKLVHTKTFDLISQGSKGTSALLGLSTDIIFSLSVPTGRPIWVDELDNSLHPYLSKFLVMLFQHSKSNPYNTQLIFATHESTLLDRSNFRKDQIWITSKDIYGVTKLYNVSDIDGLRDDIPFDKWYMSGKFGGLPRISELDFIFDRS